MKTKRLFLLLIALIAVVLSVSVVVGFQYHKDSLYTHEQEELDHATVHIQSELDGQLDALQRTTEIGATNPELTRHGSASQRRTLETFVERSSFAGASVIDANGTMTAIVADSGQPEDTVGDDFGDRVYFQRAMAGETYVSDPIEADSGNYILTISTPLYENETRVGTLNAAFHLEHGDFFPQFTATLEDRQGLTIESQSGEPIYTTAPSPNTDLIERQTTLSETGWTITVSESRIPIQERSRELSMLQGSALVFVLGTLSLFGWWVYRRNLAQLEGLLDGFEGIENQEYQTRISLDGADEWQRIEHGFNQLSRTLEGHMRERRQRERALERYERLVENLPVGVYQNTAGPDGEFVLLNDAMVDLFDADSKTDLKSHTVSDLYHDPADREQFSDRLADRGVVKGEELRLQTLEGKELWGSVTAIAREIEGDIVFDGAIQDVTTRKRYEQRLEDQRDNLETLNQVLRHDVRNDLQIVLAYADLLADHVEEDSDARDNLETLRDSASQAVDLTETAREMADVMLTDADDRRQLSLSPVITDVVEDVRSQYANADVTIEGRVPETAVLANEMVESVFRNLVKNAIQHNDKAAPEVTVSVSDDADDVTVRVADNGPGVPDNQKDEIFGKGERGLESAGTGLGLYLAQTLVDAYGGDIWVEDNDPEGAVFVVTLPNAD
ncbi:PAS domain-containing sensor histidine kinase [Haloterrigena sp. H1]|uniref:ATP-binding protein n=1 Tax=Haloterrigena sp. H1 TaxID=2552943 RepID=UPI00110D290D|nr:ATP-binding protein [Haloterrigena sp. H1]TMT87818.1 PAS domain-containing sensor histidine kinase [Haloterrigena sp. H1]